MSAASEAVAGRAIPDHEQTVLGTGNASRNFTLTDPSNGPQVIFRECRAFHAFTNGWNPVNDLSDQGNPTVALDTTITDPDTIMYPMSLQAQHFQSDVMPILQNILRAGTGSRQTISTSSMARYIAMTSYAYQILLMPLVLNHLAYHFDWKQVFPFTSACPKYMYDLAETFEASDVEIAQLWLPLMKRFDYKIGFPRWIEEIKRMSMPMMSVDLNGRLLVPLQSDPYAAGLDGPTLRAGVKARLDYLDNYAFSDVALITSFLPFPFAAIDPWSIPATPVLDINRESGWYNSQCYLRDVYGDTGDPTRKTGMLTKTDGDNGDAFKENAIIYSRTPQPTWAEVKLCTIHNLKEYAVLDDTFNQLTSHGWGPITIAADNDTVFQYDGTPVDPLDIGYRYADFTSARFWDNQVDYGHMRNGTLGAYIGLDALNRLCRLEVDYLFSATLLKQITDIMAGASLREVRLTMQNAVYRSIQSGI